MDTKSEKLSLFFEKIKSLSFWQRIFGWRSVRELSYDAYEEFKRISDSLDRIIQEGEQNKNSIAVLNNENGHLKLEKTKLESSLENVNRELDRSA